jgi:hypothetical protein
LFSQSVDLAALLLYIHEFFDELGPEELRKRGAREDKPVRTFYPLSCFNEE